MDPHAIPGSQVPTDTEKEFYEKLERELWLLRSTLVYHDARKIYPFDNPKSRDDFCKNWVGMKIGDYFVETAIMRKKYELRLKKNYQDLVPREQEVLQMGNKIWNNRDAPSILSLQAPHDTAKDHHQDNNKDHNKGKGKLHEDNNEECEDHQGPMLLDDDRNTGRAC